MPTDRTGVRGRGLYLILFGDLLPSTSQYRLGTV